MKTTKKNTVITRNQVLVVILICALILNTFIHFSSPAYRFYKELSAAVFKNQNDFENEIKYTLLPALYLVMTNNHNQSTFVPVSNVLDVAHSVQKPLTEDIKRHTLDFHYSSFNDVPMITFRGNYYHVGDYFLGSPIISIAPECFRTTTDVFIVSELSKDDKVKL